jgi:hypothetical protein
VRHGLGLFQGGAVTAVQRELCALKKKGVRLKVEAVHKWAAAHPKSALHKALEWDDTLAAYKWRLSQIGELIRIHCVDLQGYRTLVSLSVDRIAGGGFRSMEEVISDKRLREILLADAAGDLKRFEERYKLLRDLVSGVRRIRKRAEQKMAKEGKKAAA